MALLDTLSSLIAQIHFAVKVNCLAPVVLLNMCDVWIKWTDVLGGRNNIELCKLAAKWKRLGLAGVYYCALPYLKLDPCFWVSVVLCTLLSVWLWPWTIFLPSSNGLWQTLPNYVPSLTAERRLWALSSHSSLNGSTRLSPSLSLSSSLSLPLPRNSKSVAMAAVTDITYRNREVNDRAAGDAERAF